VKSEETLMEARSGSDVQIDRQIWLALWQKLYPKERYTPVWLQLV